MRYKFTLKVILFLLFLLPVVVFSQNTLKGNLVDENGEPMFGVNLFINELSKGGVTDFDGNYEIKNIPDGNYTVKVSYLGYKEQVVSVSLKDGVTVSLSIKGLEPDVQLVDEVVVIGYGVSKKREVVGSITKIGTDELADNVGGSFETNLQGKAPGVQVTQGGGVAGGGARIRIRGTGSITAGGDPLYVVDGIPITQDGFLNGDRGGQNSNPLSTINPQDIESVEILKDASATAIYGSRGANGVVLITTKKGKKGKPQFNFNTTIGLSMPSVNFTDDYLSMNEWLQLRQEAWENDGNVGLAPLPQGMTPDDIPEQGKNWFDEFLRTGFRQDYNLGMRWGKEKIKLYAGFSHSNTQSYLKGNEFSRTSGRINFDYQPIDKLKFSFNTSLARGFTDRVNLAWAGGLGDAESTLLPLYTPENDTFLNNGNLNPAFAASNFDRNSVELRSINALKINIKPHKNLDLNLTGALDYMNLRDSEYSDSVLDVTNGNANAKLWKSKVYNYQFSGYGEYNFAMLPERHRLKLMGGLEFQESKTTSDFIEIRNISNHIYKDYAEFAGVDTLNENNGNTVNWRFFSNFYRLQYVFVDKIILQGSYRLDGSSRYGKDRQYGHFPSLGVAYILSEEKFLKDSKKVSFLKLKTSIGLAGNSNVALGINTFGYNPNNTSEYGGYPTVIYEGEGNDKIGWESNLSFDAGIEIGFLRDRITTELSFYNKRTLDAIVQAGIQSSTGLPKKWQNVAGIQNRGVEFQITSRNIVKNNFLWRTDFNLSHNKNKVLSLENVGADALQGSGDTRVVEGEPIGVNYLIRFSHVDAESGLPVFLDKEGNETFDWNEENRVSVGSVQPLFTGGLSNSFTIRKNFSFEFFFTFSYGGKIYDDAAKRQFGVVTDWTMNRDILNRWTEPGQEDAKYPRLTMDPNTYGGMGSEWFYNTDQWLHDAHFLRLKRLSMGYTLPKKLFAKNFIRGIDLKFTAINLFVWSSFYRDPEIVRDLNSDQAVNLSPNVTYLTPPNERAFNFSVNVNF